MRLLPPLTLCHGRMSLRADLHIGELHVTTEQLQLQVDPDSDQGRDPQEREPEPEQGRDMWLHMHMHACFHSSIHRNGL